VFVYVWWCGFYAIRLLIRSEYFVVSQADNVVTLNIVATDITQLQCRTIAPFVAVSNSHLCLLWLLFHCIVDHSVDDLQVMKKLCTLHVGDGDAIEMASFNGDHKHPDTVNFSIQNYGPNDVEIVASCIVQVHPSLSSSPLCSFSYMSLTSYLLFF